MSIPPGARGARRILRNTAALAVAKVAGRANTLVITLLIAAQLGADDLGVYSTAVAVWGALTFASEAGAIQYLIRELSKDPSRTARYVVHLSLVAIVLSLMLTLVALLAVQAVGYSPELETAVSIVVLGVMPSVLNGIQGAVFIAHGRAEFEAGTTLAVNGTHLAVSAVLLAQGYGVQAVLASFVGMQYLATASYFVLISRFIARLRLEFEWALARKLMFEVRTFAATSALAALFARPEVIILSLVATPTQVGYYSAAMRVAEVWQLFPRVFMTNVYSALSRSEHVGDGRFMTIQRQAVKYVLAFCLPLTAAMVAGADRIIPALYGSGFDPAIDLLRIFAVGLTFTSLGEVFWPSLFALGQQSAVLRIQLLMVVVRLGGGSALTVTLSALGAAIAVAASAALNLALLLRACRRHGGHAPLVRTGWRLGLAALAMGGLTWFAASWLEAWQLVPMMIVAYVAAVALVRAFSVAELRQVLAALKPG